MRSGRESQTHWRRSYPQDVGSGSEKPCGVREVRRDRE